MKTKKYYIKKLNKLRRLVQSGFKMGPTYESKEALHTQELSIIGRIIDAIDYAIYTLERE